MQTFRILLVDDDEDDYLLMGLYLKEIRSYRIILDWVDTYEKALRYFRQQIPHILIVDYRLHGARGGLDLVLELKANHPSLPAILVSAQDKNLILAHRAFSTLDGYIHKVDLSTKVLAETISPLLD